jgi:hypothetical protein
LNQSIYLFDVLYIQQQANQMQTFVGLCRLLGAVFFFFFFFKRLISETMSRAPHSLKKRERRDSLSVGGRAHTSQTPHKSSTLPQQASSEAHFGFAPVAFVDDVVNACNDYAYDGVDYVERKLRVPGALPRGAEREVGTGADAVLEAFQRALDLNLDRFELYALQNLFVLPDASAVRSTRSDSNADTGRGGGVDDSDEHDHQQQQQQQQQQQSATSRSTVVEDSDVATEAALDAELEALLANAEELHSANALLRDAVQQTQADIGALQPLMLACRPLTAGDQPQVVLDALMKQVEKLRLQYTQAKELFDASPAAAAAAGGEAAAAASSTTTTH